MIPARRVPGGSPGPGRSLPGPDRNRRVPALWRLFLTLAVAAMVAACSPVRLSESVALIEGLSAGTTVLEAPDREPVVRQGTTFKVDGTTTAADLYNAGEARAGLVLVPGIVRAGKEDPRVIAFATTLARARFRVLVPDVAGMRALRASSGDARILAAAARHLESHAPDQPLGMAAVSFAAGPAVLALHAGAPVDFMITIGGYYDLIAAVTFFTTGHFRTDPAEPWQYREPNAYGKWVFVMANAARIRDPDDRVALEEMADRKLDDLAADITDLTASLGPSGQAVHALLTNDDPERVPELIDSLPQGIRAEIAALNLKRLDPDAWTRHGEPVHFVLIHGEGDPIIPETESIKFAQALGPERSDLYLVEGLRHVEAAEVGMLGSLTMLTAAYRVLTLRDGH